MPIYNLYSKRQKKLRGEVPEVYQYDDLPDKLRVQIIHIWNDCIGSRSMTVGEGFEHSVYENYQKIVDVLRREYGVFKLTREVKPKTPYDELTGYFLNEMNIDHTLDVIEVSFKLIDMITREESASSADAAIEELNGRLREDGIGYQFVNGEIVRVDSELLHEEVVKPALRLLNDKDFQGAEEEFLAAHEHYRHGRNKEALNDALKSFESVLKSICSKRGWAVDPKATSNQLIATCYDNGLIPDFWQDHMKAVRKLLEGGVPTARNRLGGHGQGSVPTKVPEHLVAYVLHMTASSIVFLIEAEKAL